MAAGGHTLVYGGGKVGLMGAVADAVLGQGGQVIGVIPEQLVQREVAHERLSRIHIVKTMHERKALMAELADGFIALPGGPGTLEELAEAFVWDILAIHDKRLGLLNVAGYYDALLRFLEHMTREGFLRRETRERIAVDSDGETLLETVLLPRS